MDEHGSVEPKSVHAQVQTDELDTESPAMEDVSEKFEMERNVLSRLMDELKQRIQELESDLKAKDELLHDCHIVRPSHPEDEHSSELQEALTV